MVDNSPSRMIENFRLHGYAIIPCVLTQDCVSELIQAIAPVLSDANSNPAARRTLRGQTFGLRNLLSLVEPIRLLADSQKMLSYVTPILGPVAFPVRGLYFDKTPGANWKVPWHQDLAIAVTHRPADATTSLPNFGPWSIKSGVHHVEPPSPWLERRLALRLHLDPCRAENGPLRVLPGTHLHGRLNDAEILQFKNTITPVDCLLEAGDLLAMHPLLLHASSPAQTPAHRRVIHLEYAADPLPDGLSWSEQLEHQARSVF